MQSEHHGRNDLRLPGPASRRWWRPRRRWSLQRLAAGLIFQRRQQGFSCGARSSISVGRLEADVDLKQCLRQMLLAIVALAGFPAAFLGDEGSTPLRDRFLTEAPKAW